MSKISTRVVALNAREQRVVDAYLRAGGAMSKVDAYKLEFKEINSAARFFKRKAIQDYIQFMQREAADMTGLSIQRTLRELASVAFANHQDIDYTTLKNDRGQIDIGLLPRHVAAAIKTIKFRTEIKNRTRTVNITEVTLHNKPEAIDKLMRHFGAYEKDNVQAPIDIVSNLLEAISDRGLPKPGEIIEHE